MAHSAEESWAGSVGSRAEGDSAGSGSICLNSGQSPDPIVVSLNFYVLSIQLPTWLVGREKQGAAFKAWKVGLFAEGGGDTFPGKASQG